MRCLLMGSWPMGYSLIIGREIRAAATGTSDELPYRSIRVFAHGNRVFALHNLSSTCHHNLSLSLSRSVTAM